MAVRWGRRIQRQATWSHSVIYRGRRWFDRGWFKRSLSTRVQLMSRCGWHGFLSDLGWVFVVVHRQRDGRGAMLPACTAGGTRLKEFW